MKALSKSRVLSSIIKKMMKSILTCFKKNIMTAIFWNLIPMKIFMF